jgi:hypothetical protein
VDIRQTRGLLGDKIALCKERLTYTRPRTLSQEQCENIIKKIETLMAVLPAYGENHIFVEPTNATVENIQAINRDTFKQLIS